MKDKEYETLSVFQGISLPYLAVMISYFWKHPLINSQVNFNQIINALSRSNVWIWFSIVFIYYLLPLLVFVSGLYYVLFKSELRDASTLFSLRYLYLLILGLAAVDIIFGTSFFILANPMFYIWYGSEFFTADITPEDPIDKIFLPLSLILPVLVVFYVCYDGTCQRLQISGWLHLITIDSLLWWPFIMYLLRRTQLIILGYRQKKKEAVTEGHKNEDAKLNVR